MSDLQLIAPDIAINSIVVYIASGLIALASSAVLFAKVFPATAAVVFPFVNEATTKQALAVQRNGGVRLRVLLLFMCSILMVVDSINATVMLANSWTRNEADYLTHTIFRILSIVIAGPAFTVAMAMRISCIIVMDLTWKARFMHVIKFVAAFNVVQSMAVMAIKAQALRGSDASTWLGANFAPPWSGALMIFLPIVTVGGSIWSLKIAFSHASSAENSSEHASSKHKSAGDQQQQNKSSQLMPPPPSLLSKNAAASHSGASLDHNQQPIHDDLAATAPGSVPATHSQHAHSPGPRGPTTTGVEATGIKYPLTATFKYLTALILVWWIVFLVFVVFPDTPARIRGGSVCSMMVSLSIATECGFEHMLRLQKKRQQRSAAALVAILAAPSKSAN
ncbi:hypothetical protein BC828DRAFT_417865 [Blastocladiella britannica]|nr:hypothetical protein BC828DRAFT_417865 [Blastocladiella britannica]